MTKRSIALLFLLALLPLSALAQSYSAILTGAAEVPAADPDGSGFAVVTITGTTLRYSVLHQNIGTPIAAHIHLGAAGTNGNPVVDLNASGLTNGQTTITSELASQINANPSGYYVNVHTAEFPNGAIRGQLARAEGEGARTLYLPIIGKTKGAAGTNFVTDMRVVNNGGAVATVTLDFFPQNAAGNAAPSTTKTITVAPGEQKVLNDVMEGTLLLTGGLGGAKITSDQNVLVTARVINDLRAESKGTTGLAYDAEETGATSGTLPFLAQNADFRTNIGFFNGSASAVTATFVARKPDGSVLGSRTLTIPGFAMDLQGAFGLINTVSSANQTQDDFFVTWTSDAPLFVFASVTDNKTGDPVLNQ